MVKLFRKKAVHGAPISTSISFARFSACLKILVLRHSKRQNVLEGYC